MNRLACIALVLAAAPAAAQPVTYVEAQAPERHQGLFLRVTPGVAASAAKTTFEGTDYTLSGGAGRLGISAGWAVAPRVIIMAELLGHATLGPDLETDGMIMGTDDDVAWGVSYMGAGVTTYFRNNFYLTGTLGAMMMTLDSDDMDVGETGVGLGSKLGVGYEWWLGRELGLGIGLELLGGRVPDGDASWSVATLGLAFSATYN